MTELQPHHVPITYQDAADRGRIILRDGSSASLRLSSREDYKAIREFYQRLSPQSRKLRFFSEAKPGEDVIDSMCDSSDPSRCMTLLVWRLIDGAPRIVATGSYIAEDAATAEFAVAVDDALQGMGLGGTILERLSALAVSHGFTRFNAYTDLSNKLMLEVFRHSGFELEERNEEGLVKIALSVMPDAQSVSHALQRDRLFTKASIRPLFNPQSIAVIGANSDVSGAGRVILSHIEEQQFSGDVYPVDTHIDVQAGAEVVNPIDALPDGIDLAVIAVPKPEVDAAIDACARKHIRAVIITSAGYAETGTQGREEQELLVEKIRGYGMRLLGPNSLGVINTDPAVNLNASMSTVFPRRGSVAISSQSGALGMTLLKIANQRRIGLSMFSSMGNKADVTGNDLLYYWEDDAATDVILLYLESFGNPKRFGRIARDISRRKPIVCVKSGSYRSTREEHATAALFEQSGVIRVRTIEEMFDTASLLGNQPLPAGKRVSIITNSRGAGVLCADACIGSGLEIAYLSTAEKKTLRAAVPDGASLEGIIDLTSSATPDQYGAAVETALESSDADAIILIYTPVSQGPAEPVLDAMTQAMARCRERQVPFKTIITVMMADTSSSSVVHHRHVAFPCYHFPEKAAHTLAAAYRYRAWREAPPGIVPEFADIDIAAMRSAMNDLTRRDGDGRLNTETITALLCAGGMKPLLDDDDEAAAVIDISQHAMFGPVLSIRGVDNSYRMIPLTDVEARTLAAQTVLPDALHGRLAEIILRLSFIAGELPEIAEMLVPLSAQSKILNMNSEITLCV